MSRNNSYHNFQYNPNNHQNRHQQELQEGHRSERYHGQTYHQQHHYHDYHPSRHHPRQLQDEYSNHALPPLPPGWVEAIDPHTGTTYYANSTTQESQWDRPQTVSSFIPPATSQDQQQQLLPNRNTDQMQGPIVAVSSYSNSEINTDRGTGLSAGEDHYKAGGSWAPTNNAAIWHPEKIVHVTRDMLEKVKKALPDPTLATDLELHSLTPGQVADLCKLQRRIHQEEQEPDSNPKTNSNTVSSGNFPPYTPINPYTMPISGSILIDRTEPGRLDVRMSSLRRELEKFGYHNSFPKK